MLFTQLDEKCVHVELQRVLIKLHQIIQLLFTMNSNIALRSSSKALTKKPTAPSKQKDELSHAPSNHVYKPKSKDDVCVSKCKAVYKVDTWAKTDVVCHTQKDSDAKVRVNGKITLSDKCEIVPGCVTKDDCDPCVTNVSFDVLLPIDCSFAAQCQRKVGSAYVVADVTNYLYNKVTPVKYSQCDDKKNNDYSHDSDKYHSHDSGKYQVPGHLNGAVRSKGKPDPARVK